MSFNGINTGIECLGTDLNSINLDDFQIDVNLKNDTSYLLQQPELHLGDWFMKDITICHIIGEYVISDMLVYRSQPTLLSEFQGGGWFRAKGECDILLDGLKLFKVPIQLSLTTLDLDNTSRYQYVIHLLPRVVFDKFMSLYNQIEYVQGKNVEGNGEINEMWENLREKRKQLETDILNRMSQAL